MLFYLLYIYTFEMPYYIYLPHQKDYYLHNKQGVLSFKRVLNSEYLTEYNNFYIREDKQFISDPFYKAFESRVRIHTSSGGYICTKNEEVAICADKKLGDESIWFMKTHSDNTFSLKNTKDMCLAKSTKSPDMKDTSYDVILLDCNNTFTSRFSLMKNN